MKCCPSVNSPYYYKKKYRPQDSRVACARSLWQSQGKSLGSLALEDTKGHAYTSCLLPDIYSVFQGPGLQAFLMLLHFNLLTASQNLHFTEMETKHACHCLAHQGHYDEKDTNATLQELTGLGAKKLALKAPAIRKKG